MVKKSIKEEIKFALRPTAAQKMIKLFPKEALEKQNKSDAEFNSAMVKYATRVKSNQEQLNFTKMLALLQECIGKRICSWCGGKVELRKMNDVEKANFYRAAFCKFCTLAEQLEDKEFYVGKTNKQN
jgi:hypothetical protein|tara:strand:+ start:830 stop:1210 length:381 start_codon:yes stop_codon:yes gene_type:complete